MLQRFKDRFDDWTHAASARELSRDLRDGQSEDLRRRRGIAALSLVSAGAMGLIALYQMGMIRRLPDLPGGMFDATQTADPEAYQTLQLPDAVLALRSHSTTLALAAAGAEDRAETQPLLPLAVTGKALFDAYQAGSRAADQWSRNRAFSVWSLVDVGASLAIVPLTLPESLRALRHLREG